ncbi:OmpH family outer membrane protein [uncultured Microscilla sp.]|uniref:OmpH family outer membrane protein n=1 Tax=uncultured Microscilla sp. TaxID=432653 RepID=UPI00261F1EAC|nr:OmpH family outer membrane protein [uncultured Microscilla sp.]
MMRRLLVVALVATVLYGCGNQNSTNNQDNNTTETAKTSMDTANDNAVAASKIVYINEDSLLTKYEFAKRIQKDLTTKGKEIQADLASREQNFKNEVASYQRTAGTMTMNVAKATEQRLAAKQRNLQGYSQVRGKELADEQSKMMKKLRENVESFLKRFCEKNGYDLVLPQRAVSTSVLYGNAKLDVTDAVVTGLNKEYADGKTGEITDDKKKSKDEDKKDESKKDSSESKK